jgi:uncharacterized protein (DUF1810 family)
VSDLARFGAVPQDVIDRAVGELRAGRKTSHWMWFVFPQIAGLGSSPMAVRYAIRDLAEARALLADPLLADRLAIATDAMLDWAGKRSAEAILGGIDAIKLRSSMTLFEIAAEDAARQPFAACLDAFYAGVRDPATLARLGG